jgi:glycosyltransferase involved in cell wall biosynthesis
MLPVSVQIITLNEEVDLCGCLASVRLQDAAEVLVIDGGSTDGTCAIAREFGAQVVLAPKLGRGAARALGYQSTEYKYVAMVDADDRLPVGWLKSLLTELKKGDYAALQGSLRVKDPSNFWEKGWNEYFTESIQPNSDSPMVGHPAIYARRDLVETLNQIGHDHEDTQLSILYEKRHLRQGISGMRSYRRVENTWAANRRKWISYGRGYRDLVHRYPERRSAIMRHVLWTIPIVRGWRPLARRRWGQPLFGLLMGASVLWGYLTPQR